MEIKVAHLITGLGKGGAETMLFNLLKYQKNNNIKHKVISLGASHFYEKKILNLGIEVIEVSIKKHPLKSIITIKNNLVGIDIINCWMYHCNFLGYYLNKIVKAKKIIWNIRHSSLDKSSNKFITRLIARYCANLSSNIEIIAYNGEKSKEVHENIGFDKNKSVVLRNGCDLSLFKYNMNAKKKIYEELGIAENKKTVLSIARFHTIKDIPTFFKVIKGMKEDKKDIVGIMCGKGINSNNKKFMKMLNANNLVINEDIFALGLRNDIPDLLSACDLFILHSKSEAFPNVLIQAMACETNIISTRVGDVEQILTDDKFLVNIGNYNKMISLTKKIFSDEIEKKYRMVKNKDIVYKEYDINNIVEKYEKMFL